MDPIFDIAIGAALEQKSLGLFISQNSGVHVAVLCKKTAKPMPKFHIRQGGPGCSGLTARPFAGHWNDLNSRFFHEFSLIHAAVKRKIVTL